jgi:hypothetical protein
MHSPATLPLPNCPDIYATLSLSAYHPLKAIHIPLHPSNALKTLSRPLKHDAIHLHPPSNPSHARICPRV